MTDDLQKTGGFSNAVTDADVDADPSRLNKTAFFLLFAVLVVSTLAYGGVDIWTLSFLSVLAAALGCVWLADGWKARALLFSNSALQLPLLGLAVIGLIQLLPLRDRGISSDLVNMPVSAALTLDPFATKFFVIQVAIYSLFFAAALTFINHRYRLRKVVLFIIIFVAVVAFFGILQKLANLDSIYGLRLTPQSIPFGPFVNQHHFAALMEMASGLTLGLLFGKATGKANRPLLIIAGILMGIAIIFTGSRGGLISFIVVVGIVIAINFFSGETKVKTPEKDGAHFIYSRPKLMMLAAGSALIVFIFVVVFLLGGEQSVIRGVGLQTGGIDFTTGRTHFWAIALRIFWDHPILGAGLDAFGNAFPPYDSWAGIFRVEQAHNDYLQILADAGIVGFLCVAAFIFLFFKKSVSVIRGSADVFRRNTAVGALAGCCGILVHSFFDFPLRTPANAFFFLTLVTLATVSIYYPPKHRRRK